MKAQIFRLAAARLGFAVLTLLLVSAIIFAITGLLPGDAAQQALGQAATPEQVAALRHQFGLDQPAITRYGTWLVHLFSGNLGISLANGLSVRDLVVSRLPNSLMLAGLTTLVSVPVALLTGILSAIFRGSLLDRILNILTLATVAVPEFLVATLAVLIFAVKLRWLPALSYSTEVSSFGMLVRVYAMPVMTLCCVIVAQMARMTRAAILDQLNSPYVEMARLKGASPVRIVIHHVLPNAIGPIANAVALSLSYLFGGVVIVESIFNFPGLASLMVDAVTNRDLPVVQACVMAFCAAYLLLVLIADLCQIVSNPRLRNR
jgi:peptide/nickel transport system permease protein